MIETDLADVRFDALLDVSNPSPRVRAHRTGLQVAVWKRPGLLSAASQDAIHTALAGVSARVFGDISAYWEHRRRAGWLGQLTELTLFGDPAGELVGWACHRTSRHAGRLCVYMDSAAILPRWQRSGVMSEVYAKAALRAVLLHPWERIYLTARTGNPAVYRGMQRLAGPGRVHPVVDRPVPARLVALADSIAGWLGEADRPRIDGLTFPGCYGPYAPGLWARRPRSGDDVLDQWFEASLGPDGAFLVIAEMGIPNMVAYCVRELTRSVGRR